MPTSFGAIMASAADQSRIAREKDEANQLAMMQAGFIPKEQPPQAEPSGLQSMLSSVRDQYAYQPQHAPTDYVPGPGHASSMQTERLLHDKRLDQLAIDESGSRVSLQGAQTDALNQETAQKKNLEDLRKNLLSAQVDFEKQRTLESEEGIKRSKLQRDLLGKELDNYDRKLETELRVSTLQGNKLAGELRLSAALEPTVIAAAKAQLEIAKLQITKGGQQFITDPSGAMYLTKYNTDGSMSLSKIFGPSGKEAEDRQYRHISMLQGMVSTAVADSPEQKEYQQQLRLALGALSLSNTLGALGDGQPTTEITIDATGKRVGGEPVTEDVDEGSDRADDLYEKKRKKGIGYTSEEEEREKLRDNKPAGVSVEDWNWYVRYYKNRVGLTVRPRGGGKRKQKHWDKTEENRTRWDDLNNLYEEDVKSILGVEE